MLRRPPTIFVRAQDWRNLRIRWWTAPKRGTVLNIRDQVLQRVKDALSGAGIDLPFPTRVVLFHDQSEDTDGDRAQQREGWPKGESSARSRSIAGALTRRES